MARTPKKYRKGKSVVCTQSASYLIIEKTFGRIKNALKFADKFQDDREIIEIHISYYPQGKIVCIYEEKLIRLD